MGVQRVEYGIHADNWLKWGVAQAIKEIIANARDSGSDFEVSFDIAPGAKKGFVNVIDTGSGFPRQYLMVGAGETKGRGQVGQFREGLKGAMCVAARNKRKFSLDTTGFSVEKVAIEDILLGPGGFVLYVDFEEHTTDGTSVTIEATECEVRTALRHFNGVKCRGLEIEECSFEGVVAIHSKGRKGKIFINDALACEIDSLFDYNFSLEALGEYGLEDLLDELKDSQNRDREVIRFEQVEYAVSAVLTKLSDESLIRHFFTAWESGQTSACEYRTHGGYRGNQVWQAIAKEIWPGKVCQAPKYSYQKGQSEREWFLSLRDRGWNSLPDDLPPALLSTIEPWFPTVTAVHGKLFRNKEEKKMDVVEKKDWTAAEKQCLEELQAGLVQCFGLTKCPEFRMYSRHYEMKDACGLWYKSCIWFRRDYLNRAIGSPGGFTDALGTAAHEYAHGSSGLADDRTREFEHVLTSMLGQLMMKMVKPETAVDVEVSGKETFDLSLFPEVYTYEEIAAEFESRGRQVNPHGNLSASNPFRKAVEQGLDWHYIGGSYHQFKGGVAESHSFAAVNEKGKFFILHLRQPLKGKVMISGCHGRDVVGQLERKVAAYSNGAWDYNKTTCCLGTARPFRQELRAAASE